MNAGAVLVLHGSPGAGKTTVARAIAERLREAEIANAAIDLDELSVIYPHPHRSFALANLTAIWPNYTAAVPGLKLVIPTVLAEEGDVVALRAAVPGAEFVVCELTAPKDVLIARVTEREPNEYWRKRLRDFVDLYHHRDDLPRIRDLLVSTHDRAVVDTAREIVEAIGWQSRASAGEGA